MSLMTTGLIPTANVVGGGGILFAGSYCWGILSEGIMSRGHYVLNSYRNETFAELTAGPA